MDVAALQVHWTVDLELGCFGIEVYWVQLRVREILGRPSIHNGSDSGIISSADKRQLSRTLLPFILVSHTGSVNKPYDDPSQSFLVRR